MAALTRVARGECLACSTSPRSDHAVDRLGNEIGPVGEHHDSCLGLCRQSREAAAQRSSHAALPLGAAHDARVRFQLIGALDDDDLVHGARAHRTQHVAEHELLLRRTEAARLAGGEDDGGYHVGILARPGAYTAR